MLVIVFKIEHISSQCNKVDLNYSRGNNLLWLNARRDWTSKYINEYVLLKSEISAVVLFFLCQYSTETEVLLLAVVCIHECFIAFDSTCIINLKITFQLFDFHASGR